MFKEIVYSYQTVLSSIPHQFFSKYRSTYASFETPTVTLLQRLWCREKDHLRFEVRSKHFNKWHFIHGHLVYRQLANSNFDQYLNLWLKGSCTDSSFKYSCLLIHVITQARYSWVDNSEYSKEKSVWKRNASSSKVCNQKSLAKQQLPRLRDNFSVVDQLYVRFKKFRRCKSKRKCKTFFKSRNKVNGKAPVHC